MRDRDVIVQYESENSQAEAENGSIKWRRPAVNVRQALYIRTIAEEGGVTAAAKKLHISQPSLSKYLKNLEERLGAPLFSRHENRYYPTYMGERYLHYAEQIVACGDEWMQEYDDIAHRQRGRLNIAVPIMMGSTLIDPARRDKKTENKIRGFRIRRHFCGEQSGDLIHRPDPLQYP
mgnify:CR=1 FL=1